jgi:hypothetical protein
MGESRRPRVGDADHQFWSQMAHLEPPPKRYVSCSGPASTSNPFNSGCRLTVRSLGEIYMTISTSNSVRAGLLVFALVVAATAPRAWADSLISLNAPVSVVATDPDPAAGYNNGTAGNLSDITDGTLLPSGTAYWSAASAGHALEWSGNGFVFQINLGATFQIDSITLDADDNDEYILQYLNGSTNTWQTLWDRPIESEGVGLIVVSDTLGLPIDTDAVRILGGISNDNACYDGVCGQGGYAVNQVELFGTSTGTGPITATPEPGSLLLLGSGLLTMGRMIRRRIA